MTTEARIRHIIKLEAAFARHLDAVVTGQLSQPGGMLNIPLAISDARNITIAHAIEVGTWIEGTIPGE